MSSHLLDRNTFRSKVFERDNHQCLFCNKTEGLDAHHILERRLFSDGGYYINNGATVCQEHHLLCEKTLISVEEVRLIANIIKPIIPEHLYSDVVYDKWSDIILPNGTRLPGELFYDESVQKALSGVLHLFSKYVKYPRTYHLPFSPGTTKDDRTLKDTSSFENKRVIATIKLDGECTTFYNDYIHARSLEYESRIDRDWIKAFHANIAVDIPNDWRLCGENVWAEHSIKYKNLESPFFLFSIWEKNKALSWDDTVEYAKMLNIQTVPVIYDGIYSLHKDLFNDNPCEGFVLRLADSFSYSDFRKSVAKYVRKGHVTTQAHWTRYIQSNEFTKEALKI